MNTIAASSHSPAQLIWLRDDLRLDDHPALCAAAAAGPVCLVYILEEGPDCGRPLGGAARWWLHHSLTRLAEDAAAFHVQLVLRRGDPRDIIPELADTIGAEGVHWNRRYFHWSKPLDAEVKARLASRGIAAHSHKGSVLTEPWEVKTATGTPFKVFSPFFRAAQDICDAWAMQACPVPQMIPLPQKVASDELADWDLLPTKPDWADGLRTAWTPGSKSANDLLESFIASRLAGYKNDRNIPGRITTSRLSPHLRFGEISIRRVWNGVRDAMMARPELAKDGQHFLSELGWREFSFQLIHHYDDFTDSAWKPEFRQFPWRCDAAGLTAWQKGLTGYPLVDAGMRELWTTGWMHNRVRMVVASFLIKHLLIDWRAGEAWFWDTLVDADIANNAAGWQWVAGSGADAAPYFRIFNPTAQGETYDGDGDYVRTWVPELKNLPNAYIHRPHEAPHAALAAAGIVLGKTYPRPLVEHGFARQRALDALASLKSDMSGAAA